MILLIPKQELEIIQSKFVKSKLLAITMKDIHTDKNKTKQKTYTKTSNTLNEEFQYFIFVKNNGF